MVKSYSKLFMTVYLLLHAMANGILLLLSLWSIACSPRYLLMYDTQKASKCDRALTEIRGGEKPLSAQISYMARLCGFSDTGEKKGTR